MAERPQAMAVIACLMIVAALGFGLSMAMRPKAAVAAASAPRQTSSETQ